VTVELAGSGNEAAVYGLIATVTNVAQPFATSLTLLMDGPFDITNARVKADDRAGQARTTGCGRRPRR
jgi:hypothetical protein